MSSLLFEIGCEELPADVCTSIERQLLGAAALDAPAGRDRSVAGGDSGNGGPDKGLARRLLEQHRLWPEPKTGGSRGEAAVRVLISPRRVAVHFGGVPARQTKCVQRSRGPRAAVAFDEDGVATKAGQGFARSRGLAPEALHRDVVDGTEFVFAEVEEERWPALEVVPKFCIDLLEQIQVPRGMRWGVRPAGEDEYFRFSRPVRWLVCKLGRRTLRFGFYDLEAGGVSRGHRVLGGSATIVTADAYEGRLEAQSVVVDQRRRRGLIERGLYEGAGSLGGSWFDPGDVLAEAIYLVEWPSVLAGSFDCHKLRLPADVLITAMQSHQRYFPVRDEAGDLLPVFLYVSNADPACADLVTSGNERVLDGRLDDAEFAYDHDLAEGIETLAGKLSAVVFHEKLGSLADKSLRLQRIAALLADELREEEAAAADVAAGEGSTPAGLIIVAAGLAKADLVSGVVQEFPTLQGRMGEIYARHAGHDELVAAAIGQHYLPLSTVAPVPSTLGGSLLAIADKVDNIVGAWVAAERPTGSRDPYGLRRAAMGIVRIALEYDLRLPLSGLIDEALAAYADQGGVVDRDLVASESLAFIWERLEVLLLDEGLDFDSIQAAIGSSATDVPGVAARAGAIAALRGSDALVDVVTVYNRCASLAAKAGGSAGEVAAELLIDPAEQVLFDAHRGSVGPVSEALAGADIAAAVAAASTLRGAVDTYFDDVLVMDGDPDVRQNRLAQLAAVRDLLRDVGDFSRIPV